MAKRLIDTEFWQDEKVIDYYSPEDKYFMMYLLTNPKTTSIGIYSLPKKIAAFELGYSRESVITLLDRFEHSYKNIKYSENEQEVAVLNSLKYTISKGGKPIEDMIKRELNSVKNVDLILTVYNHLSGWWTISERSVDKTIKQLFEDELTKRNVPINKEPQIPVNTNADTNANTNAYTNAYTDSHNESLHESSLPEKDTQKILKKDTSPLQGDGQTRIGLKNIPDTFVKYYATKYLEHFEREHPPVPLKKADSIVNDIAETEFRDSYIEPGDIFGLIDYHFEHLPARNDGKIYSFLHEEYRGRIANDYLEQKEDEEYDF